MTSYEFLKEAEGVISELRLAAKIIQEAQQDYLDMLDRHQRATEEALKKLEALYVGN